MQPLDDETVKTIRKNMQRMKMNRDLEHIQVIRFNLMANELPLIIFLEARFFIDFTFTIYLNLKVLMANYRNASQLSVKIAILEDLEYYMHQVIPLS